MDASFDWDEDKNRINKDKHGISFKEAQLAFNDDHRLVFEDVSHSTDKEKRYYCLGKIGTKICTVRFIHRNNQIRIFGACYWRKEQKIYEKKRKNI